MLIFTVFETFPVSKKSKKKSHFMKNLYSWRVSGLETPPNRFAVKFYDFWPEGKFMGWSGARVLIYAPSPPPPSPPPTHPVSQSVNQSISQSVTQSVNQSISQSISQSINQLISQSVRPSISQSVSFEVILTASWIHF